MVERTFVMLVAACSTWAEDAPNYAVVYGARDQAGGTWMWLSGKSSCWHHVRGHVADAADVALLFCQEVGWSPVYVDETINDELIAAAESTCPSARA